MKTYIIYAAVIAALVVGAGFYGSYQNKPVEVMKEAVVEEPTVDEAKLKLLENEEAMKAAQEVVIRQGLERDLEALESGYAIDKKSYENELADLQQKHEETKNFYLEEKERLEKELGTYWREASNIKAYIREVFWEDPYTAVEVAMAESSLLMQQSKEVYQEDKPHWGVKKGDRELSFCIFQIHSPAHEATAIKAGLPDYKTDVEQCIKMARIVYDQRGKSFKPWSVYASILAMR